MTHAEIQLLIDYHYWARDRMLEAVAPLSAEQYGRDLGNSFKSVHDTLMHLYGGEWVWYSRWHGTSPMSLTASDMFQDLPRLTTAWLELEGKMRAFIAAETDASLLRTMTYTLFSGKTSTSVMWHMIQHVVNHASYHRGQITTMLRQLGAAPPKSEDLIAFYREKG